MTWESKRTDEHERADSRIAVPGRPSCGRADKPTQVLPAPVIDSA